MRDDFINGRSFLSALCGQYEPSCTFCGETIEEFEKWQKETREKLKELLCFHRLDMAEYNAEMLSSVDCEYGSINYKRQLWHLNTFSDLEMPVYVLVPKDGNGKAALALHCHGSDGKNGLVGLVKDELGDISNRLKFTYAFELLEKGYTVFCPDLLGSGDRKPVSHSKPNKSDCTELNFSFMSMGFNLQGVVVNELMRCIDFAERSGGVSTDELVCVGFSGGGLFSLLLAAVDDRVKTTYISGYFHSLSSTLLQSNFCGCNFIPNLWKTIDTDGLAMLIAPRRLLVETGRDDKLNGTGGLESVQKLVENTKNIYEKFYNADDFVFEVCDGAHRWYGALMDKI